MSATPRPAPPRWPMDHAPPASRTTHVHTHRAGNPLRLHSTASAPDSARPRPAMANDPPPDLRRPRPTSPPTDGANVPSTALESNARIALWHRSDCRQSPLRSPPKTTTSRTARSSVRRQLHWSLSRQDPTHHVVCFATPTSLGTTVHAPGCAAVVIAPPPARTGCPDAPAPAAHAPSPMPAVAPASTSQTTPRAMPAC